MQTNHHCIMLHLLMLLTICVLAQILSQNTAHFTVSAPDYTLMQPNNLPLSHLGDIHKLLRSY